MEKYTREELAEILKSSSVDGKISQNDLASIIFDERFPDELFMNGSNVMIEYSDKKEKLRNLANSLESKMNEFKETIIQKDRDQLMEEMEDMGSEMDILFEYFKNIIEAK